MLISSKKMLISIGGNSWKGGGKVVKSNIFIITYYQPITQLL